MKKIINPWKEKEGYNCFGCAPNNPVGVKMEFYEDGDEIVSLWYLKPEYQGWIDSLHGGIQAVLLDEICGWTILRKLQTGGVTSKMETRYLKPVSTTDDHVVLRAHIQEKRRNIILLEAGLYNQQGELCTKALCTYFTFPQEKAKAEMHFMGCEVEEEEITLKELQNEETVTIDSLK
ncbi:PaaI family thioesterase [Bacteroides ihuae]|uniref:PaaI family thioesterase n=1 Tax=Bacteroides ihuae TaxID=1852362 RepID=UPI0008D9093E|nr:PaaI family thioesterase [Bacteroides ihuae]